MKTGKSGEVVVGGGVGGDTGIVRVGGGVGGDTGIVRVGGDEWRVRDRLSVTR